jgi:NADH:ubiquinone oxidoreductase subunit K
MLNLVNSQWMQLFAAALFCIGFFAVLTKKNLILVLIGIELMINASLINLAVLDKIFNKIDGQMLALFAMVLSAASIAVALAIIIKAYQYFTNIDPDKINKLKN